MQELIDWAISLQYNQQQCIDWIVIKDKAEQLLEKEKIKQETLEVAAEKYSSELLEAKTIEPHEKTWMKSMFIHIAKWQQEQQDDFIIKFLESIEGTYSYSNIYDHWYSHANTNKTYTKKELLNQFKKKYK